MNLSLIGSWMQAIAVPWLTLNITNNPFLVSLVAAFQFLPPLFLSVFAGALVDKFEIKKILILTQTLMMIVALMFSLMMFFNIENFYLILFLSFLNGVSSSLDAPARQSFVYELVEKDELISNAVALNSMSFNVARVIGPAIAGVVIAKFGLIWCFLGNAISFFAIIISLFFISIKKDRVKPKIDQKFLYSVINGLKYVKNSPVLRFCLLILLCSCLFLPHYSITVSAYAKYGLMGNEKTFGYLMSFLGVGAFLGALFIASYGKVSIKTLVFIPFIASLGLSLVGISGNFYLSGVFLALTGASFVITNASINSILQLNTKSEYRGRVMSIYALCFSGSVPFGALFSGWAVSAFTPKIGFIICAISAVVSTAIVILFFRCKDENCNKISNNLKTKDKNI
ncbi:MFS transporter [Campylobacter corcagiensis]|nr:MFS transporter [Campylobacter corcagiensis]